MKGEQYGTLYNSSYCGSGRSDTSNIYRRNTRRYVLVCVRRRYCMCGNYCTDYQAVLRSQEKELASKRRVYISRLFLFFAKITHSFMES